ncbi:MAG: hypothetical protein ACE5GX_20440 [Thermoanaerobaculia bacterium]
MKKLIGCVMVFLLGVGATLAYLAWRDRAESREEAVLDIESAMETRDDVTARAERARQRDGSSQIVLAEADLEALITTALSEHPRAQDLVRVVREVHSEIGENRLEIGVSVDIGALERSGLADQETLDRLLGLLPMLRGQELYLGFRGKPGASDGKIALVDDLEVTLGFLNLPVDDLEDRLGFSAARVYENLAFDVQWFRVEEVRASEGELALVVRGTSAL